MNDISDKYSIEDIERALDRIAAEIAAHEPGKCLLPIYQWLEEQLETRRRRQSTMDSVMARLQKKKVAAM